MFKGNICVLHGVSVKSVLTYDSFHSHPRDCVGGIVAWY